MDLTNTMLADDADVLASREPAEETQGLTSGQLIERILEINTTASESFLRGFTERRLRDYLDHLRWAHAPRDRRPRERRPWVQRHDMAAMTVHEPMY